MSQTTYQVILSSDGKHTVIVTADDKETAKTAFGWAKATYDRLVEVYGLKYEQYQKGQNNGNGEDTPVCAVHKVPMAKVNGRHGPFWSCHQKNADGSFCSYKPKGQ